MPAFPERLTAGGAQQSMTYTLAEGHYLVRTHTDNFSAVERFAPEGLVAEKLPAYIEAARMTLEPAGFRWIEIAPGFRCDPEVQRSFQESIQSTDEPMGCGVQVEGRAVARSATGGGPKPEGALLGHFDAPPDDLSSPNAIHAALSCDPSWK